jgi:hypothetical protein
MAYLELVDTPLEFKTRGKRKQASQEAAAVEEPAVEEPEAAEEEASGSRTE